MKELKLNEYTLNHVAKMAHKQDTFKHDMIDSHLTRLGKRANTDRLLGEEAKEAGLPYGDYFEDEAKCNALIAYIVRFVPPY